MKKKYYKTTGTLDQHLKIIKAQLARVGETNKRRQFGFAMLYFVTLAEDDKDSEEDMTSGNGYEFINNTTAFSNMFSFWPDNINAGMAEKYKCFREVSVIANGKLLNNQDKIHKQIGELGKNIVERKIGPFTAYAEFMMIYPFLCGSELMGHLIWASIIRRDYGKWPMELPPEM